MNTVFISYRRETSGGEARALFENLTAQLGHKSVFMDVDSLALGRDFRTILRETLASCDLMLVLIDRHWADAKDERGRLRLQSPDDFVRLEIGTALKRNIPVTPVLLQGAPMPSAQQLPSDIRDLAYRNGFELSHSRWESDVREMVRRLDLSHPGLTAQQWFERGFVAAGLYEKLWFYTEALRLKPDLALALHNRGVARQDKGDFDEALADLNEALRLMPNYAAAFSNRGAARQAKGDLDGALADLNEALSLKPDDAGAFNNRGIVRRAKGDLDGALADYNEALRLKPDLAEPFILRGIARRAKGDVDGALADFTEALRLKPDFADPFILRGNAFRAKGDLEGALRDHNAAITLRRDDASTFYHRAVTHRARGDLEGALQDYNEAIRLKPDFAEAYYNRALVRRAKGDLKGVLLDYNEAVRLKPDYATRRTNPIHKGWVLTHSEKHPKSGTSCCRFEVSNCRHEIWLRAHFDD
jgi:tetratricopeptide (TPR) repeat protein